jgi:hypothetical protein
MSWRMKLHLIAMSVAAAVCIGFYYWLTSPQPKRPAAAASQNGVVFIDVNPKR